MIDASGKPMLRGTAIEGVRVIPGRVYQDQRGWLLEVFRDDEIEPSLQPTMAYVSMTLPGVVRGPHEHREQTDWFCFAGPSEFTLTLWDPRAASRTRGARQVVVCGEGRPAIVMVPPGVVHAYRNSGPAPGLVFNCPDRLYAGRGKKEPVDEIRHEGVPGSPYVPE